MALAWRDGGRATRRGATSGSRSAPSPTDRSGRGPPRPSSKAPPRHPKRPSRAPRRWRPRSSRSTTSARRPTIAGGRGPGPPPDDPRRRRLVTSGEPIRRPRSATGDDPLDGVRPGDRRSFWLRETLATEPPELAADVAAPQLTANARPTSRSSAAATRGCGPPSGSRSSRRGRGSAIVEQDICGGGPSGRNGGFVTGWWDELPALIERFGEEEAVRTARALDEAVDEIGTWTRGQRRRRLVRRPGSCRSARRRPRTTRGPRRSRPASGSG